MPFITEVRELRPGPARRSSEQQTEPEWRLLIFDDGRRVRVDVEQMARHQLEPGGLVAAEIVASLEAHDAYLRARDRALRLLAVRARSAAEVRERLQGSGVPERMVEAVLADLTADQLLDDGAFARAWVTRRLKQGHGLRRIRWELRGKGISGDALDSAIVDAESPAGARRFEEDQALALARRRLARYPGLSALERARRVAGFLERRGFSAATIARVLRALGDRDPVERMNG